MDPTLRSELFLERRGERGIRRVNNVYTLFLFCNLVSYAGNGGIRNRALDSVGEGSEFFPFLVSKC
jgi:hypothetical protein